MSLYTGARAVLKVITFGLVVGVLVHPNTFKSLRFYMLGCHLIVMSMSFQKVSRRELESNTLQSQGLKNSYSPTRYSP